METLNCPRCHLPLDPAELRAALNRDLAARKPKPKDFYPCIGCRAPLSARQRRLPCPHCGQRNPR